MPHTSPEDGRQPSWPVRRMSVSGRRPARPASLRKTRVVTYGGADAGVKQQRVDERGRSCVAVAGLLQQ